MTLKFGLCTLLAFLYICCSSFVQSQTENTTVAPPVSSALKYKVYNGTSICLFGQFIAQFTIPYFDLKGEPQSEIFYINSTTGWVGNRLASFCLQDEQQISLFWSSHPLWTLGLSFKRMDSNLFSLANIRLNYTLSELFPSSNDTKAHYLVQNNQSQFSSSIGSYYSCLSKETIKLTVNKDPYPEVYLSFTDFKAEAFRSDSKEDYVGYATTCSADYVPDKAVPIAVGITLAVLIIVALLTFILGSRFRQNGYAQI